MNETDSPTPQMANERLMPITKFDGARFRELREAQGFSREKVADLLGKTSLSVWRYETGAQEPRIKTLGELAAIVGVSAADLIVTKFHAAVEQVAR